MIALSDEIKFIYNIIDGSSYADFYITDGVNTIFTGRGYPIPGTTNIYFNLTNIIQDFCHTDGIKKSVNLFNASYGIYDNFTLYYRFYIKTQNASTYTNLTNGNVAAVYNDDYTIYPFTIDNFLMHKNEYQLVEGCWMMPSIMRVNNTSSLLIKEYQVYPGQFINNYYNNVPLNQNFHWNRLTRIDRPVVEYIYNGYKITYKITPRSQCNAVGCLYWINRFGGVETLLIQGINDYSTDNQSLNYTQNNVYIKNRNIIDRTSNQGNTVINKTIKKKWRLTTNFVNDSEWCFMETLYTSPAVWYQDFTNNNNSIHSVVVTDTIFKRQLFKEQGRVIPDYEINIEGSISKNRR